MPSVTPESPPNPTAADVTARVDAALAGTGLFVRAAFHPAPEDGVPPLADGAPAGTALLVGNAGNAMWRAFRQAMPDPDADDPLDRWVKGHLVRAAEAVGADYLNPMRAPYPPVQRWAMRAEGVHPSPLGLLIHRDFGLWHVYRGVLLFAARLDLPPPPAQASPCETCANRPCLNACPVDAFRPAFSPETCVGHVTGDTGKPCQTRACLARRACPVGRDWAYDLEPAAYHMGHVVKAVRAGRHLSAKAEHGG